MHVDPKIYDPRIQMRQVFCSGVCFFFAHSFPRHMYVCLDRGAVRCRAGCSAIRDTTHLRWRLRSRHSDVTSRAAWCEKNWLVGRGWACWSWQCPCSFLPCYRRSSDLCLHSPFVPMNGTTECQLTDGQVCEPPTGRKCVTTSSSSLNMRPPALTGKQVWSDARRQEAIQSVGGVSLPPPPLMPPSVTQRDPWSYRTCEAQGCALGPLCLKCACQCATNTIASLLSPTPTYQARSKDALPEATPEVLRRLFSCGVAGMCATSGCELTSTRTAFVRRI
jgi:hypothetical protein